MSDETLAEWRARKRAQLARIKATMPEAVQESFGQYGTRFSTQVGPDFAITIGQLERPANYIPSGWLLEEVSLGQFYQPEIDLTDEQIDRIIALGWGASREQIAAVVS